MRIMTWNIRQGGGSRIGAIADSIARWQPDLAVLCEFRNSRQGLALRDRLSALLPHQAASGASPRTNAVMVASRIPLEPDPAAERLGDQVHRAVAVRTGGLALMGLYFPQREAKIALFRFLLGLPREYLDGRTVLAGDFNTGRHNIDETGATFIASDCFERLAETGWVDAFRHLHPDASEFSWFSRGGNGFRVDHLLLSPPLVPALREIKYSQGERLAGVSDHAILLADLES